METKVDVEGMYTPDSNRGYGRDIINMITYLNRFSNLENFMNIGYADSALEYLWFPPGISSKRLPGRLARPLLEVGMPPKNILVVGCGRGGEAVVLHELIGTRIIGLDLTPYNIRAAREYTSKKGGDLVFLEGDACHLPAKDGSLDCVFSCESAFHYGDKPRFLEESFRVLRKGGFLLIADIVRRKEEDDLLGSETEVMREFERMLMAPGFFTLDDYRSHISRLGFEEIIECETITEHNLRFLAHHSTRLVRVLSLLEGIPGMYMRMKRFFEKRNIDIENFIEHARTTAKAVQMDLVDYIIIGARK